MMQILPKIEDSGRFIGSIMFFLIGILIIIFGWEKSIPLFYDSAVGDLSDSIRIFWCIACSFIGFAISAYRASKNKHDSSGAAWKIYPTIYLASLTIMSILVFAVFHISKQTSNYLFYFLSGPFCFSLSYFIDDWVGNPIKLFKVLWGGLK